jgi:hypothetical protein
LRALQLTVTLFYFLYHGPLYLNDAERRTDIDKYEAMLMSLLARYAGGPTRGRGRGGRGAAMLALMERTDGKRGANAFDDTRTNGNGRHGDTNGSVSDKWNQVDNDGNGDEQRIEWEADGADDLITELCRALLAICVTKLAPRRSSNISGSGASFASTPSTPSRGALAGSESKRVDTSVLLLGTSATTSSLLFAPLFDDVDDKLTTGTIALVVLHLVSRSRFVVMMCYYR